MIGARARIGLGQGAAIVVKLQGKLRTALGHLLLRDLILVQKPKLDPITAGGRHPGGVDASRRKPG
jgi:hypothetical protein